MRRAVLSCLSGTLSIHFATLQHGYKHAVPVLYLYHQHAITCSCMHGLQQPLVQVNHPHQVLLYDYLILQASFTPYVSLDSALKMTTARSCQSHTSLHHRASQQLQHSTLRLTLLQHSQLWGTLQHLHQSNLLVPTLQYPLLGIHPRFKHYAVCINY